MKENKQSFKRILDSEPAATVGGLLTVHREAPKSSIVIQGILDGMNISTAGYTLLMTGTFDLSLLLITLAMPRAIANGVIYFDKLKTRN